MNVNLSSFKPYPLVEYFTHQEAPQMVVIDNVVHFKHGHKSFEEIVKQPKRFAPSLYLIQVEIEYIKALIEKISDENACFALNKLLALEELLLSALMQNIQLMEAKKIDELKKSLLGMQNPNTQQLPP